MRDSWDTIVYKALRPFLGPAWRISRAITYAVVFFRYHNTYSVSTFMPGKGIHHKYLLTERQRTGNVYLVKTTSPFIEWWLNIEKRYCQLAGLEYENSYGSNDIGTVLLNVGAILHSPKLKELTLLERINIERCEIWYRFEPSARAIDFNRVVELRQWDIMKEVLRSHKLEVLDVLQENIMVVNGRVVLIDLESIRPVANL